jgi:membrane fusion protein, multidrug efflux system
LLQGLLHNQILIPNVAVRRGAPNGVVTTFVYVVNSDRTVAVRPVTLGVVDGERVAVQAGLAVGEIVVTEGGDRLRDGAPVVLPSATPAPAAGARPAAGAHPGAPGTPGTPGAHHPRTHAKPQQ